MSRLSRGLLAAVLATSLAAPATAAEVDALLPAESEAVFQLNIRQLLDSSLTKKYALGQIEQMLKGNDAQKTLEKLGLDPLKDIERMSAGVWGKGPEDMQYVAVVRGKFDLKKLMDAAQDEAKKNADKVAIVSEGDYTLIKITGNDKPAYLSGANDKTLVVGAEPKLVAATLKAAADKAKPALKKELAALVLKQDEKATLFAVGLSDGKGGGQGLPPGVNIPGVDTDKLVKQLEKVSSFAMTLRVTDEVGLEIIAGMKDADAADDFGATLEQLVGTAKTFLPLVAGQQPKFKPLADELGKTLKAKTKDKDVVLALKLSADAIGAAAAGDQ